MIRKWILLLMALLMVVVMICTWGSLGSAIMGYGLLSMGASVLYQIFVTNHTPGDYQMEE